MKKLFLSLFVAGALTFGLQSCDSEEPPVTDPCDGVVCGSNETCVNGVCEPNSTTCDVCGTYDGTADGDIAIALIGTDTSFTNLAVSAIVTENSTAGSYNMGVDISSILGAAPGTLVPDVDGTLSGTTMTITNQEYVYQQIATITINGTVNFDATFDNLDGSLALTGDAVGDVDFVGAKQ